LNKQSNQTIAESDLISGCINGDRKMQRELYERYSAKMFGVCLRYAGSTEEAEDILQEGFIKVFKKIGSYRGEGSFEGWIRRIFVNTAIEQFRRKTYMQPITEREENSVEATYLSVLDSLAEKDIVKLVQQLSPGYRTVFNMYVVEGFTHRQIAESLGISEGTSKSQLSRAKIILQDLVKKHIEKKKEARNE
jgi:RNA polymerase sigma-70 factor (ECF subfamily)